MKRSQRVYERLAQAFPHEFKLAHGDEMLQTGKAARLERDGAPSGRCRRAPAP